jgi:hypothetical protein
VSTKSREFLFGSRLRGAEIRAQATREKATAFFTADADLPVFLAS